MWTKTYSVTTKKATREQVWKTYADVNHWHVWDDGIEYAKMQGTFQTGNTFRLKPKGGPEVKISLLKVVKNKQFTDVSSFPLAKMYDDHVFEDTPEGLKITVTISVTGILSFLWVKIVAENMVKNLPTDVNKMIKTASKL